MPSDQNAPAPTIHSLETPIQWIRSPRVKMKVFESLNTKIPRHGVPLDLESEGIIAENMVILELEQK